MQGLINDFCDSWSKIKNETFKHEKVIHLIPVVACQQCISKL